jgi:hypothetical protein
MSPGSVTERLWFFLAEYSPEDRISAGGGHAEGEDIEVLEIGLDEALEAVHDGRIIDAKTIMLLQHLKLEMLTGGYRGAATSASKAAWRGRKDENIPVDPSDLSPYVPRTFPGAWIAT